MYINDGVALPSKVFFLFLDHTLKEGPLRTLRGELCPLCRGEGPPIFLTFECVHPWGRAKGAHFPPWDQSSPPVAKFIPRGQTIPIGANSSNNIRLLTIGKRMNKV
jgi:hypothetical protein